MLLLVTCFLYWSRMALPICAVTLAKEFGWSKTETGMVLGAYFWGYCFTQVLGGHASDRWVFLWRPQVIYKLWQVVEYDDEDLLFLQDRRRESPAAVNPLLGRDDSYHSVSGQHWTPTSYYHDSDQVFIGCNARWEHCKRQLKIVKRIRGNKRIIKGREKSDYMFKLDISATMLKALAVITRVGLSKDYRLSKLV